MAQKKSVSNDQNQTTIPASPYIYNEIVQSTSKTNNATFKKQIELLHKKKRRTNDDSLSRLATVVTALTDRLDEKKTYSKQNEYNYEDDDFVPALIGEDASNNSSFDSNDSDYLWNASYLKEDCIESSPIFERSRK